MVIKDAYSCPSVIEDKLDKCPNFTSMYLLCLNTRLAKCLDRVLIVEALAGAFNREKVPGPEHCETSRRFIDSSTGHSGEAEQRSVASHCFRFPWRC